jgi:hypothetical protein
VARPYVRYAPLLLLLVASCAAEPDRFLPADGRGSAAYYELERDGRNLGDVKVWSTSPAQNENYFDVRFRVRNDSAAPIDVDLAETYAELRLDGRVERARPRDGAQKLSVPAGQTREFTILFTLPPESGPQDIDEAEVNWALATPNGRLTHSTVFLPHYEESYWSAYPYGAGYYRPWGWGWYDAWP